MSKTQTKSLAECRAEKLGDAALKRTKERTAIAEAMLRLDKRNDEVQEVLNKAKQTQ